MKPIYILASERSGTNLLRQRIMEYGGSHHGPPPLHVLKHLYYNAFKYESVSELTEAMYQLSQIHFAPWDNKLAVKAKEETDKKYFKIINIINLAHEYYLQYAMLNGYNTYICKDNHLFKYVCEINKHINNVVFVYLFRDPRDVILSETKRPGRMLPIQKLARRWAEEQRYCLTFVLNNTNCNVIPVSYERLIKDEKKVIEEILNVAGTVVQPNQTKTSETGYSKEWVNLRKVTMKDNTEKWKRELINSKLRIIESECWSEMVALGYVPEIVKRNTGYHQNRINQLLELLYLRLKAKFELRKSSEHWRIERSSVSRSFRLKKIDESKNGFIYRIKY